MATLTNGILHTVSLFYNQGTSDKEYNIFVKESSRGVDKYDVFATYGRRGNANQSQTKANGVSRGEAMSTANTLQREKENKGYRMGNPSVESNFARVTEHPEVMTRLEQPLHLSPPGFGEPHELTEMKPQLLNPILVSEMEAYIENPDYLVQEKLDGKRIMVTVDFGHVTASNRRSWKVGIPQNIADELSRFPDCELDGELVGGTYVVFDCLKIRGVGIRGISCAERFEELLQLMGDRVLNHLDIVPTAFDTAGKRALVERLAHKEGVVFKQLDAPYTAGRPNKGGTQLKCKFWASATCLVTGLNDRRSVNISVDSPSSGLVPVGSVTIPPNYEMPVLSDRIEVKYLYYYPGGALYQPQYLGVRDDTDVDFVESLKPKSEENE